MNGKDSSILETSFVQVQSYAPVARTHGEIAASVETEEEQLQNASAALMAIEQQCLEVIADAKQEAEAIVQAAASEAAAQAEQLRVEAAEQGFKEGLEKGRAEAEAELQRALDVQLAEVQEIMASARMQNVKLIDDMHKPLTQLVMTAVKRLLQRELAAEPADIHGIVEELLIHAYDSLWVEVRVNPEDYQVAVAHQPSWQTAVGGKWDLTVIPDARVSAGGCEIRSEKGRIDATVETKLELLADTVAQLMKQGVKDYVETMD